MAATVPAPPRADVRIGIGDDAAVTVDRAAAPATQRRRARRRLRLPASLVPAARDRAQGARRRRSATSRRWAPSRARLYVWLGVPGDFGRDACLELCDGLAELAERGGRRGARRRLTAAGRWLGLRDRGRPRRAAPSDLVGRGGRRAGRRALRHRRVRRRGRRADAARASRARRRCPGRAPRRRVARQLDPAPRLAAGPGAGRGRREGDDRRLRRPRRRRRAPRRRLRSSGSRSSSTGCRSAPGSAEVAARRRTRPARAGRLRRRGLRAALRDPARGARPTAPQPSPRPGSS